MLSHKHEHLAFKQEKSKFKLKTKPILSFEIQILLGFSPSDFNERCRSKYHLLLCFWTIFNFCARIWRNQSLNSKLNPFQASKFKFYWVLAQVPLMKVVDLGTISNFAFGQFLTSMQEFGEK